MYGDTVHIIDSDGRKHKIRMAYIDAPEINQAYGTQSRDNLIDAALNKKSKSVCLKLTATSAKLPKYLSARLT